MKGFVAIWAASARRNGTFWTERDALKKFRVKLRSWDEIPTPRNYKFEWHECKRCKKKFPFVLHPNPGMGLIAHESHCRKPTDDA